MLSRQHSRLNSRPRPDDGEISRLKKQKLQIKDEIATRSQRALARTLRARSEIASLMVGRRG